MKILLLATSITLGTITNIREQCMITQGQTKQNKIKFSVSFDSRLAAEVAAFKKSERLASRSAALEKLVIKAFKIINRTELEADLNAYYSSLPKNEIKERDQWSKSVAVQSLSHLLE